jgi:hypothetical protein
MSSKLRRQDRIPLRCPVRVTWQDRFGTPKFLLAKAIDISESGVRVELTEAVAPLTPVGVQSDRLRLACSGLVRNCVRCGAKYLVGIEFAGAINVDRVQTGDSELVTSGR